MKIGILTLPLHTNYGGILQAYALQKALKDMGHDVCLIDRRFYIKKSLWRNIKNIIKRYLLNDKAILVTAQQISKHRNHQSKKINSFISTYIETTIPFYNKLTENDLQFYNFDTIIVGSDQVWRKKYVVSLYEFFLDFAGSESIKKSSYAASFGISDINYTKKEIRSVSLLLQKFNKISVREESGVSICKSKFDVQASLVLDPTMLLSKNDYTNICNNSSFYDSNYILEYFLDMTEEKNTLAHEISHNLSRPIKKINERVEILISLEEWLSKFNNAQYIITDSFHGCVFSILFNKPFIVYVNKNRGVERIISLLNMFNLKDRMIFSFSDYNNKVLSNEIDWRVVNEILKKEKEKSLQFLKDI